jgi:hypothetical protein
MPSLDSRENNMQRPFHQSFSCALSWLTRPAGVAHSKTIAAGLLLGLSCLLNLTACGTTSQQRLLYQTSGIQVGIMIDGSTNKRATPPVRNRHPANLTPKDIRLLLGSLEVSGWSGAIVGLFSPPHPKPVFTEAELVLLAEPLATAFHEATPGERVFFVIQNLDALYETDRTSGSLFFRDEYLHVVLTDHYAFLQADPGGGEKRDPRDTKGMTLSVVGAAGATDVPDQKQPQWNALEKIHISLIPAEILAGQRVPQAAAVSSHSQATRSATGQPTMNAATTEKNVTESVNDLRLQISELTHANLDLRAQLKEQAGTIEKLKAEFEKRHNEKSAGASKPSSRPQPFRNQTTP